MERAQRLPEAAAAYEQLLARWPDLPDSWYNLGLLHRKLRRYDDALASYQQALDRGVSRPEEAHLNRGVILADCLRRDKEAERELHAALALNPTYIPALLNLANLYSDLGRRDEASAVYHRILALDPDCHEALARYAGVATVSSPDDPLIGRLRRALAGATPEARASLGFALGKALDESGTYDQAFDAYAAANLASRESAGPRAVLYDRPQHEALIEQLIASFGRAETGGRLGGATPRPIFICGMFRSGSTLTEQVLAGHSRVTSGGELDLLPTLAQTVLSPFPARMAELRPADIDSLATHYLAELSTRFPGADVVTDKRPDNFLYIGLIKRMFPDARIVHTTRNPLDNCLSIYFLHLDHRMGYALDLMDIAHYYRQYRRLMAHWKRLYGADILDFDYDVLVHETRPAVERLLRFCGLGWEERCLEFHTIANAVKTASVWQVRQPLYRSSSGRSRHYTQRLAPLRAYLSDMLGDSPDGSGR